ncbi:hypothetical protein [Pseudomonas juntendi]|uniref:Uncharacterized protein n=1 Tax=Pseudomonas juntendi TaxID=2666183 RepID=A0AAJ5RTS0_9PSED|nr:hypothetical protein [Pseudomonas juntendi]WEA18609.1 hypothetical protein PWA60_14955 [Pseudomonas juntendi]
MRKALVLLALFPVSMPILADGSSRDELKAAADAAFNAASYCHNSQAVYQGAVLAARNGVPEGKILETSGLSGDKKGVALIALAVSDSAAGRADPKRYYDSCMNSVRTDVNTLIDGVIDR